MRPPGADHDRYRSKLPNFGRPHFWHVNEWVQGTVQESHSHGGAPMGCGTMAFGAKGGTSGMPTPTRDPWELASGISRRLRRANVPSRPQADPLLAWAAWNLKSAQLGWDVLERARPGGDDNLTGHPLWLVELAAMNLVFRGVVSAMDQCAAAIFRLTGEPYRADREHSVGWWFDPGRHQPWALVPAPLAEWLRGFDGSRTWALAKEVRDGFTHRTVQRRVTLGISGSDQRGFVELAIGGVHYETDAVMRRLLPFGNRRYSAFERALTRSYPLRGGRTS